MDNSTNNQQNTPTAKAKKAAYHKQYNQQYRLDNKDKLAVYDKQHYLDNKDKLNTRQKQYRLDNKAKWSAYSLKYKAKRAVYYLNNKDKLAVYAKQRYLDNKEKLNARRKQRTVNDKDKLAVERKRYYLNNKNKFAVYSKQYRLDNKLKLAVKFKQYVRQRCKTDPLFKSKCALRSLVSGTFKRISQNKPARTEQLLGCSWLEAKAHFEQLFEEGMSWENHGEWHIDHIRPVASFKEDELHLMNHISNLQPLWAKENLGAKRVSDNIKRLF